MSCWDTSALVKLYVTEPDSADFLALVAGTGRAIRTSDLARVELYSTLSRKEGAGELPRGRADQLYGFFLAHLSAGMIVSVPLGADVLAEAKVLVKAAHSQQPPLLIRSLDALHVASAVVSGSQTMVATDTRLRAVAQLSGLRLFP